MASSDVANFFNEKNVFITGGTGFLGICVIEKLLRCCPGVNNIYVLIRPKKGKEIQERLEELTKNSVFERIKRENGENLFKKLIPVAGDVGEENLALSANDRLTLVEHVNIVIHSAATLDFEADLKSTVNINLLGTRRVVLISQEIRDLKALVHISSAYVNSVLNDVEEKLYPPPADVKEFLKMVERTDDHVLEEETRNIIKDHPNPYTFTKHLAEHEVANSNLPATILRPSMITGAWNEPVPGWTISKNGPQGFLMGASKGVVRRLPIAQDLIYDYIPVDIVANTILVAAYNVGREKNKGLKIYHCTSSTCNPFRWEMVAPKIDEFLHKYPLRSAVWYPSLKFLPSLFWFRISAFFLHMIPAYILDTVTKVSGGRPILVRLHTNVNKSLALLEKFIFTEWKFDNSRTLEMHESLSKEDKELFTLDIRPLNWEYYFVDLVQGVRHYLSKENPKNLEKARSKDKMLMMFHLLLQAALLALVWWITKIVLRSNWTNTGLIVPLVYVLFNQL